MKLSISIFLIFVFLISCASKKDVTTQVPSKETCQDTMKALESNQK